MDYDPAWAEAFEEISGRLWAALGSTAMRIDHVGSTAVEGLSAKPVVDVQVSVEDITREGLYRPRIEHLGFILRHRLPQRRFFRPATLPRTHHIHVVEAGSQEETKHLLFVEHLRANPDTRRAYARLKQSLARRYPTDRQAYTDAKYAFIEGVLGGLR